MLESGSESQWEPEWESQRAIKSQRDPVKAWESKLEPKGARVGVTVIHLEGLLQKIPYFDVSRQKRVLFNCFATKQCLVSLWLSMALCDSHSGSHWLSLPLSGILWPSLVHYCSLILLIRPLIGSQGPCSALIADATMTHFVPLCPRWWTRIFYK